MSQPPKPVVHLELHTGNLARACLFYERLLGWRPERVQAGGGSYLALETGGEVGGGVVESEADRALWLPYVQTKDAVATTELARELGAAVLLPPREGPVGWRGVVSAPDGGALAFWQPKR
jgi:predicted enzyme related to lactoylglutathione lyase